MGISIRKAAKELGVSHVAILKAAKSGSLKLEADGSVNLDNVRRSEWFKNRAGKSEAPVPVKSKPVETEARTDADQPGDKPSQISKVSKIDIDKLLLLERREKLRTENRVRRGELLERAQVKNEWSKLLTAFKNKMLYLPGKLARKVAPLSDDRECRVIIEKEVREALEALSGYEPDAA